jgi:hypothetical protein
MTSADEYVQKVVEAHAPRAALNPWTTINELYPHIHTWANGHEFKLKIAGSIAKGTAISGTSDIDLFISLNPSVGEYNTHEQVYSTLRDRFTIAGYSVREQNVSLGIDHGHIKLDIVAGVRHNENELDHSIWKRKKRTWTKTNIDEHIAHIHRSGRVLDIKAIKIWRKLQNLDFPSFYLELSVIEALKGRGFDSPASNFADTMRYLANDFVGKTLTDPANTANEVSEELTDSEKQAIRKAATVTLERDWPQALR